MGIKLRVRDSTGGSAAASRRHVIDRSRRVRRVVMNASLNFGRGLIAALLLTCGTRECAAGEKEQVDLMEKAVAQFERLNTAASTYTAILERVTDARSAESVLEE